MPHPHHRHQHCSLGLTVEEVITIIVEEVIIIIVEEVITITVEEVIIITGEETFLSKEKNSCDFTAARKFSPAATREGR